MSNYKVWTWNYIKNKLLGLKFLILDHLLFICKYYYYYRESKCCYDSYKLISSPASSCPNYDHMMTVFPQPHHDNKLDEICESCIRIFPLIGGWTVNSWFYNKLAIHNMKWTDNSFSFFQSPISTCH